MWFRLTALFAAMVLGGCSVAEPGGGGTGPFCGGIAGIECPGAGTCVDDPGDDCDPNQGGADCGGICQCNALGLCVDGLVWDSNPEVCGCGPAGPNPCAAVLCPVNSTCEVQGDEGVCVPIGQGEDCGPTVCDAGMVCCNESCGICTEPGGFCTEQYCTEEQTASP